MKKIEAFNIINGTELDEATLGCAVCKDWLSTPIYQQEDGFNLCEACAVAVSTSTKREETMLDGLRLHFKYPCKFEDCDAIMKLDKLQDHMKICMHQPCTYCLFCKEIIERESSIRVHMLDTHPDVVSSIDIETPVANLNIPLSSENEKSTKKLICLNLNNQHFYVYFSINNGMISLIVCKPSQLHIVNDTFTCKYTIYEKERTLTDKMINFNELLTESILNCHTNICLLSEYKEASSIDLKIYFCGYEEIEKLNIPACRICLNNFSNDIYQCDDGHPVCSSCVRNIKMCGICLAGMNRVKINLKHVFPNLTLMCPNSTLGCINIIKANDLDEHLVNCSYSQLQCDLSECREEVSRCNFVKHMKENHKILANLSCYYFREDLPTKLMYIPYKNSIFECSISINREDSEQKIVNFNVVLWYTNDFQDALNYCYEIHLLNKSQDTILYRGGNVCQPEDAVEGNLSIPWETVKPCLYDVNDEENMPERRFNFRCFIYDSE